MSHNDIAFYLETARKTEAFSGDEICVLDEVLRGCFEAPGRDYTLLDAEECGTSGGFLIFGPTPMSAFAWDLYWIVVDPSHQRKGVGLALDRGMCAAILSRSDRAVIRVETAGRSDYDGQRHFYERAAYRECGRIPNFYSEGDDLVLYCKEIRRLP